MEMRCSLGEGLLKMLANCFSEGGWCRGVTGGTRGSLKRLKGLFFKSKASVLLKSHKADPATVWNPKKNPSQFLNRPDFKTCARGGGGDGEKIPPRPRRYCF